MKLNKQKQKVSGCSIYTKIQQAKPIHLSTLINKQLGYDVIIQLGANQSEKIKNCICSTRPNSQIYKRVSKQFILNIKQNVNQLYVFTGIDTQSRLQTSIGIKNNPGLFMIFAIAILDEKYHENHSKFDLEISFLQYEDSNIFDLLNYTGEPLKITKRQNDLHTNQSYVKICTFKQFLKLFKVALFNNKQRDFKTGKAHEVQQPRSTFIMKIKVSIYDQNNKLERIQENVFIDLQLKKLKEKIGNKCTAWEYIMMELNNSNPLNKKIHYHLIEENYLLNIFKSYLRKGQTTFFHSMPANHQIFLDNLKVLNTIKDHSRIIWEIKPVSTPIYRTSINWEIIKNLLEVIQRDMRNNHYSSLRELQKTKKQCVQIIKKCNNWIKQYKLILLKYSSLKRQWKILVNTNIVDEIQLIGSCVKSDHFKDFYTAKSYLSLEKQIQIRAQNVRKEIKAIYKSILETTQKYLQIKIKQQQSLKNLKQKRQLKLILKVIEVVEIFMLYFKSMQLQMQRQQQRTIMHDIIRQQRMLKQIESIYAIWKQFLQNISDIGDNCPISCQQDKLVLQKLHFNLFRELKNQRQETKIKKAFTKLPLIQQPSNVIKLGSINLSDLLFNPRNLPE